MAFCVWLLSLSIIFFKVHPRCSIYQYFIASYGSIIFHFLNIPHFVYSFTSWWTLSSFHFLATVTNAAMNIWASFYGDMFSIFLGIYLGVELPNHMITSIFNFWGTDKLFSNAPAPFYTPTSNVWGLQFLHIFINNCHWLFYFSQPSKCEVVPHGGFD